MAQVSEAAQAELHVLDEQEFVARIWQKDPSVWVEPSPGGDPASQTLGWLTLPDQIADIRGELAAFADEMCGAGFEDVVLLGMGGSSLGPLVLGEVFGPAEGYLRLHVLDSTVPGQIKAVQDRVDLSRTLFLVSSKSGTTVEPLSLYHYFRKELEQTGSPSPGDHFVAITDPGTALEERARSDGFRRALNAPEDVGGRFSVLSPFGLLPAALLGVDLERLADGAMAMAAACGPGSSAADNPGAALGAALGAHGAAGRDKITLISSPRLASFGLWVEQLLAEATGKNGRGIVPGAGEPFYAPGQYGDDRLFIYTRLQGDENSASDEHAAALEAAGQPIERIDIPDVYSLGAEFFRWEFAVAVAARALAIYPFDQPDVEAAKQNARALLEDMAGGVSVPVQGDIISLVTQVSDGDYVAIAAYLPQSEAVDWAIEGLRSAITGRTGAATTFGYGPRYLHSTGQLHKGGPASAAVLVLGALDQPELPVPGADYGFHALFMAQLAGDVNALRTAGRRITVSGLTGDYAGSIRSMAAAIPGR
ncbi:MAG: glucose-6-phosphate isomerase [Chloroflexota bacterium]